jgi:GMP synthase-like glutamine amidotransferase
MSFSATPSKGSFAEHVGFGKRFTMGQPNEHGDARKLFTDLGFTYVNSRAPEDFDFVVFSGGADICPLLYGQPKIVGTNYQIYRDITEIELAKRLPSKMPKLGICRGGQLLNVLGGGSMYQHVDRHAGVKHNAIITNTTEVVEVNSVHHQMMIPGDLGHVLLRADTVASVRVNHEKEEKREDTTEQWIEPEAIWYRHIRALCFQPHPEYGHDSTLQIFARLVRGMFPKVTTTPTPPQA